MSEEARPEVTYAVIQDHIALITLDRPQVRNAINAAVASALDALVKRTEADDAIRAVVLASSSPRAFCAGADLATMAEGRAAELSPPTAASRDCAMRCAPNPGSPRSRVSRWPAAANLRWRAT